MKRYISAILIPCLLLQFYCCTSSRPIAFNELENEKEAVIVTKDATVYKLNAEVDKNEIIANPDIFFAYKWNVNADSSSITLNTKKANKEGAGIWFIGEDTKNINFNDILSSSFESDNVLGSLGIVLLLLVGALIYLSSKFGSGFGS